MKNKLCRHNRQKGHCRACRPKKYCEHKVHASHCRICKPTGWAGGILSVARGAARRRGYVAPHITSSELVALMSNKENCVLCGGLLDWAKKPAPHLHHSHETGQVYGFTHQHCNQAAGMLAKMKPENLERFIRTVFVVPGNEGR